MLWHWSWKLIAVNRFQQAAHFLLLLSVFDLLLACWKSDKTLYVDGLYTFRRLLNNKYNTAKSTILIRLYYTIRIHYAIMDSLISSMFINLNPEYSCFHSKWCKHNDLKFPIYCQISSHTGTCTSVFLWVGVTVNVKYRWCVSHNHDCMYKIHKKNIV